MKNGVPFDVAFRLPPETRAAFSIVFTELESGKVFDWDTEEFVERK